MGDKDTLTKQFMRDPEVFADAFNYLIYDGEQVIKPSELVELDTTAISMPYDSDNSGNAVQKNRDVFKRWVGMYDDNATYLMLGIENQSNIHYAMPARNMMYDAISYDSQIKRIAAKHKGQNRGKSGNSGNANDKSGEYMSGFRKNDKLVPVITLVIYFGVKEWDGPIALHDMFRDTDSRILQLAQNYRINLISPYALTETQLQKLQSKLREAMAFIKYSQNKQKLAEVINQDPMFHNMDRDTVAMLNEITGSHIKISKGEEKVDMCLAIQQMIDDGVQQGIKQGIEQGIEQGIGRGIELGMEQGIEQGIKQGIEQGMEQGIERGIEQGIEQGIGRGIELGMEQGILGSIRILRSLDLSYDEIFDKIKAQYGLTDEKTREYMDLAKA